MMIEGGSECLGLLQMIVKGHKDFKRWFCWRVGVV